MSSMHTDILLVLPLASQPALWKVVRLSETGWICLSASWIYYATQAHLAPEIELS